MERGATPRAGGALSKRLVAVLGPALLVAVGYMDPGNWATDIGGGSAYNYQLLSVVAFASVTAIYLQALSAKLGIVTGRDLAQMCRDSYAQKLNIGFDGCKVRIALVQPCATREA